MLLVLKIMYFHEIVVLSIKDKCVKIITNLHSCCILSTCNATKGCKKNQNVKSAKMSQP